MYILPASRGHITPHGVSVLMCYNSYAVIIYTCIQQHFRLSLRDTTQAREHIQFTMSATAVQFCCTCSTLKVHAPCAQVCVLIYSLLSILDTNHTSFCSSFLSVVKNSQLLVAFGISNCCCLICKVLEQWPCSM